MRKRRRVGASNEKSSTKKIGTGKKASSAKVATAEVPTDTIAPPKASKSRSRRRTTYTEEQHQAEMDTQKEWYEGALSDAAKRRKREVRKAKSTCKTDDGMGTMGKVVGGLLLGLLLGSVTGGSSK